MSHGSALPKKRTDTVPADGQRLERALGDALGDAAAAVAAPAAEQLDLLAPVEVAPEWAADDKVLGTALQVEAGRRRTGRPPGAANKVGTAFWAYAQQLGLPDPAIEALRLVQVGPVEMARLMGVEKDKAAELYIRLILGMMRHRLPTLASLAVSGDRGSGVNVQFNLGGGSSDGGADGALVLDGHVGNIERNQGVSDGASGELENPLLERGSK